MSGSCDPMDCSLSGSSVHGALQARTLEWLAISFSITTSLAGLLCLKVLMMIFKTASKLAIEEFTWIKPILSEWDLERALKRYRSIKKKR